MNRSRPIMLAALGGFAIISNTGSSVNAGSVLHPLGVAPAQQQLTNLRRSPYSSGLVYALAARMGLIRPGGQGFASRSSGDVLTCKKAPCAFPNSVASSGSQPVNETPIATNPVNRLQLLTAGNDYNCSSSLQGYFASSDGGSTWTATCGTIISGSSGGLGDAVVGYDLNGTAYRGGIDNTGSNNYVIVVDHSKDNGKTWSAPVIAVKPFFSGGLSDKPWLQIDTSPNSPGKNTLYVSSTQFDTSNNSAITMSHSTDHGKTWKEVAVTQSAFPMINQFSDVAIGRDGIVYVSWMRCSATGPTNDCGGTNAQILLSKSKDGGNTWSKPALIEPVALAPDSCGAFYGCIPNTNERLSDVPPIASDNSRKAKNGTLYTMAYSYVGYTRVQITKSVDGGKTWATPKAVSTSKNKHDQFFPWLSVSHDGAVGATWMDRRNDPSNLSYEEYGAASVDGGATFPNLKLASQPSNPNNDGFGGGFMGDYSGNVFAGESLYASWTDTRSGRAQDIVGGLLSP